VKAGEMTSVRSGDNSGPLSPIQATMDLITEATGATTIGGGPGGGVTGGEHHIGTGTAVTLGILAAIPAIVIPIVATRGTSAPPAGCNPATNPNGCK
jgi:hypothetical protein